MNKSQPEYGFDFEQDIFHDKVTPRYLVGYVREEGVMFNTISTRVLKGNPYIENGGAPTGLRDLEFSFDVKLTHIQSGAHQDFTREDLGDHFTVIKKNKIRLNGS